MSTFRPGGRRSLDGPVRRVRATPPAATPLSNQEAPPPESFAPRSPASDAVEFEYKKPYVKQRFGGTRKWPVKRFGAVFLGLVFLALVGWFGIHAFLAARNIIGRANGGAPALLGALDPTKLKGEGDGRINILVLGIGGPGHDGPYLSDTMLVVSIDPKTKDAAMLSVPRDLYVKIPGYGYGKINSANAYGGPELAGKVVSNVIGVPIHYYVQVDFSGFKQAIDAVGGVEVNVQTAIRDPEYPCDDERGGICPFKVNAGQQHMNGTVALRYARSRKSTSDFDRAARQQIIIAALRQKALQVSTLTNPVKLTGLIDAVGGHVKTDFQAGEIRKMALIAKDINASKMTQKVLDTTGDSSLLIDGSGKIPGAGSIELPRKGSFDYSDIQDFVKNIFVDHYITDENARLEVQNGSGIAGLAGSVVKSLTAAHYNLLEPSNALDHYSKTVIYDYTGGKKPYTINYLEHRFGVSAQKTAAPTPVADSTGKTAPAAEIRIILGTDYQPTSSEKPTN